MERIITENKEISQPREAEKTGGAAPKDVKAGREITIRVCAISHRGCVRENNEDNFFLDGDLMPDNTVNDGALIDTTVTKGFHLVAVCDGMGGLQGGERASSIGVHAMGMLNMYMPANTVSRAFEIFAQNTSGKVYADSIEIGEESREGTTLALLYLADGRVTVGNVGDSRVYLLRMGKLFQLSTDQSPVYRMLQKGEITREQMRKHPQGNVIGAYLGMTEERKPKPFVNVFSTALCEGDRFMLCSDGLSDLLQHEEMRKWLADIRDPRACAERLVMRALEMGGKDNTTCIIADVSGTGLPQASQASLLRLPQDKK